jgi:hypothetical protein
MNEINAKITLQTGIPIDKVDFIINSFWKAIKKDMIGFNVTEICIRKFIKMNLERKRVERRVKVLKNQDTITYKKLKELL